MKIEEIKKQFETKHHELHREWTANVGKPDYDKQVFRDKEKELNEKFRKLKTEYNG